MIKSTILLTILVWATLAVSVQVDPFIYQSPEVGWIQLAGVCAADPQQITCWKPTGEADAKLSELISASFLVSSNQRLAIRYRKRSLMIVTKTMLNQDGRHLVGFYGLYADPGGQLANQSQISYGGNGEEATSAYWYYPADGIKSVDLSANVNVGQDPVQLPVKVGAEVSFADRKIKITGITQLKPSPSNQLRKGPLWSIQFETTPTDMADMGPLSTSPIGSDGQPITRVDDRGNPAKEPADQRFNGMQPYVPVFTYYGRNEWQSWVNPGKLDHLLITPTKIEKVSFKNIALQPRG